MTETQKKIYAKALYYLAKREYSALELQSKLRDFEQEDIEIVLATIQNAGMQSDLRYAKSMLRHKSSKGYGENYIISFLISMGVSKADIKLAASDENIDYQKELEKYLSKLPKDLDKIKLQKKLFARGFALGEIQKYVK